MIQKGIEPLFHALQACTQTIVLLDRTSYQSLTASSALQKRYLLLKLSLQADIADFVLTNKGYHSLYILCH